MAGAYPYDCPLGSLRQYKPHQLGRTDEPHFFSGGKHGLDKEIGLLPVVREDETTGQQGNAPAIHVDVFGGFLVPVNALRFIGDLNLEFSRR